MPGLWISSLVTHARAGAGGAGRDVHSAKHAVFSGFSLSMHGSGRPGRRAWIAVFVP